ARGDRLRAAARQTRCSAAELDRERPGRHGGRPRDRRGGGRRPGGRGGAGRGLRAMTTLAGDLTLREPDRTDAPAMASLMVRGNITYREFAPRFWQPPAVERTQLQWHLRL